VFPVFGQTSGKRSGIRQDFPKPASSAQGPGSLSLISSHGHPGRAKIWREKMTNSIEGLGGFFIAVLVALGVFVSVSSLF